MAATLPPIKGAVPGTIQQQYIPSPPQSSSKISARLAPIKTGNLSKYQTSKFRNSYRHNLCLDMLEEGFHASFEELFALIQQQEEDRLRAGPESVIWTQHMLQDQYDKLDVLKVNLTRSEAAGRKDNHPEVYTARFQLAQYFQSKGDKWLSDHFFQTCLDTSMLILADSGQTQAEAHCNMGLALEESGKYMDASEHLEAYHKLANEQRDWVKVDDLTFYTDSCIHLYRIYSTIARRMEDKDPHAALDLLLKALLMAKDSRDRHLEGEAAYTLGMAYERGGDGATALLHLNGFLASCRRAEDLEGIGRACDAIAKAYQRQGDVESSIVYLKQFVETAEQSGRDTEFSKACHNLGCIFNTLGRYDEATEYFGKAYNVSRSMGEASSMHINRVQYGIAFAHRMMERFAHHIEEGERLFLDRLVEWKSARTDEFDKPMPVEMETSKEDVAISPTEEGDKKEETKTEETKEKEKGQGKSED